MSLRERWAAQADAWAAWTMLGNEDDVLPQFYELLPTPPARVLDVGCGEGRIGRALRSRGFDVSGVDVSPGLIERALAADPAGDYRVAAAEELPHPDEAFDVVVAFNVFMNVDDPAAAFRESARVLRDGGVACVSIVHPIASAGAWQGESFVIDDYYTERPHEERIGDLEFANVHRPLETWSRFCEDAGLAFETFRELPRAPLRRWNRLPMFLWFRAVKR